MSPPAPAGRWFEDVTVGQELGPLERTISLTALVTYAGATWDFHRYHYDPAFVAELGFRAPIMDGQMMGGLLAKLLMDWGGPDAFVRRLGYRLRAMVFAGDRIILRGRVTATVVEDGRPLALCALDVVKPDGTEVVRQASAAVELTRRP